MYIQQPKDLPSACWGGLISTRAQKLGNPGILINGRMRDVQEHRIPNQTSLRFRGDLWKTPKDILIGDENGAVILPSSLLEQVVGLCQGRFEIDEKTMEALRAGESTASAIERLRN
ncbi:ribonuclease E inhibitor RraA/Dimethylmenaquinone methyltransferase [Penicillium odoratum]|uniref:ribonuclease E inhibitor RraA/Dimethylmenaquinone methyltransferase n=1 Tax=Penicillium odoratum TaxID=1167516 RepID=UPI002548D387|nr:ribonuclease E inhibitor RraA/Dimethylmenaquinone methyltransferase [Penicillium odoratum]KAJ5760784.1 ribonuclease E inhibitor RraA/Dimethylmenaquinone methyltransferase [Penicillium odoratum]